MAGGPPGQRGSVDHERIIQLHESGVPSSAITRRLGCSRNTVNRVIKEHEAAKTASK